MVADFVQSALDAHNKYREHHGVPPLAHNQTLSDMAQKWADYVARTEDLQHSSPDMRTYNETTCGENIAYWFSADNLQLYGGDMASEEWYNEVHDYNFKKGGFYPNTGHFTQVVWKDTIELGIGRGRQKDGSWIIVANYYPSGNIVGQFDGNVFPPQSGKPANGSANVVAATQPDEKVEIDNTVTEKCLAAHNEYRKKHGVTEMTHNSELSQMAQRFANYLAKEGKFEHSGSDKRKLNGKSTGENLAMFHGDSCDGSVPTKMWYDEMKDYNFNNQGFSMKTGHFTQVVWKDSIELGVGAAKNSKGAWIFVANYFPAGNMMSMFDKNVFPVVQEANNPAKTEGKAEEKATTVAAVTTTKEEKKVTLDMTMINKCLKAKEEKKVTLDMTMINKCLKAHNECRSKHGVPKLKHNEQISHMAQKYANYLVENNKFEHSQNTQRTLESETLPCGENLAGTYEDPGTSSAAMWYNEIKDYNFNKQGFAMSTGHFTQVVWKGTTHLGVGAAKNEKGMWVVVANYNPPGNVAGGFEENVFPPISENKDNTVSTKEKDNNDNTNKTDSEQAAQHSGSDTEEKKSGTCTIL